MIDLIRQSAVPAGVMRTAARGALSLPAPEMLEVLVHLSTHPVFGEQARLTLAGWDEASLLAVISDPQVVPEILDYFAAPANQRPRLLPALLENPALPEARLLEMARTAARELLTSMLASAHVCSLPKVLQALQDCPGITEAQAGEIRRHQERLGEAQSGETGDIFEPALSRYLFEHAGEIAAADAEAFCLIGWTADEQAEIEAVRKPRGVSSTAAAAHGMAVSTRAEARERISAIQKIARLSVGERVQLAVKGSRDERFILVRDGAKIVSSAVLESPKLTDSEAETFAAMKNVGENVLRGIAGKRKLMRSYAVKRILTTNPRCPIDVALPLIKELLVMDLKNLSMNKNVSDTVRRFALKMWKDKTTKE